MEILDIGISDINDTLNIKFDDDADGYHSGSGGGGSLGMEMLMNDKRRSGNSGSFADIGDLDKLESELNEIRGTKVLVRRALVLKCCLVFKYV
jgi:hypothetical protein